MQSLWHRRVWASFGLLLFLVTWRLWTPQAEFPQIPFFAALTEVSGCVDWFAITAAVLSLFVTGFASRESVWRRAMIVFATVTILLMLLNQHRFQPWAYQFVLFAAVMAGCRAGVATQLMRWIVVSIYVYSAISKLDYQFLHSLGPQFLSTLTGFVGVASGDWSVNLQAWLASLFPLGELVVGIGLLVPPTRRTAVSAAIGLHLLLMLILSPWGLSHQPGVLVWNLYFIAQAWMLFAETKVNEELAIKGPSRRVPEAMCCFVAGIVIAFPASEPFGYCDHWPAWELYSPRSSRVQVAIHDSAAERLPREIQQQLSPASGESAWRQLHIDRWSLESLSVPIYPEDRFQFGVARTC
ncbi:MAG: hypothetical protein HYV60_02365 [Planctomycetia bacterium]|nr:hypothetical protein [Planctomycetia bacterium]